MVADELWVAEKFQSNPEIAGSLRNSFTPSIALRKVRFPLTTCHHPTGTSPSCTSSFLSARGLHQKHRPQQHQHTPQGRANRYTNTLRTSIRRNVQDVYILLLYLLPYESRNSIFIRFYKETFELVVLWRYFPE